MRPREKSMSSTNRRYAALAAVAGIALCSAAIARFFRQWIEGDLQWWPGFAGRELYLAAGHGYAKGFAAGFFLAFFLVLLSLAVSSWWEHRRRRRSRATRTIPTTAVVALDGDSNA
jgi:H+/Cl- antiporter ClcA